jgi:hypothetical protein
MIQTTFCRFKEGKAPNGFDSKSVYPIIWVDPGIIDGPDDQNIDCTDFILADRAGNFVRIPMADVLRCTLPGRDHIPAHKRFNS